MSGIRKISIPNLKKEKVYNVITKINKLVDFYAAKRKSNWVYETYFTVQIDDNVHQNIIVKRISIEREFYHNGFYDVFRNSPFNKTKTLYEVINLFGHQYYPEYSEIQSFIEKLLYGHPTPVTQEDFENMNGLYKALRLSGELLSAKEQIDKEDYDAN